MAQDTKILYHRFSVKISLTNSILPGHFVFCGAAAPVMISI